MCNPAHACVVGQAPGTPLDEALLKPAQEERRRRKPTISRLLGLLGCKERIWISFALLALTLASVSAMALPVYTGELVGAVTSDSQFSDECRATPAALAACRRAKLIEILIVLGVVFSIGGVALAIAFWLFDQSGEMISRRLRAQLFHSFMLQDIAFFDGSSTGELMNRLSSDCTAIQSTLTQKVGEGAHQLILAAVGLTLMARTSVMLTLVALGAVPLIGIFALFYAVLVQKLSERYQTALARASDVAQEALSAIRTVRSFAKEMHESRRYDECVQSAYRIGARRARATGVFLGFVSATAQYALVVVLWVGCLQVIEGKLEFGKLTSFLLLAIYVVSSLGGLMGLFAELMQAVGASRRIFALLETAPAMRIEGGEILDRGPPHAGCSVGGGGDGSGGGGDHGSGGGGLRPLKGALSLVDIHFAYPTRPDAPVLRGLSLSVAAGQCVALVGASGGGKSSIIALIERWYDPIAGAIYVDGVPLVALDPSWWRRQVALVAQEPVLFAGSVLANLTYGRENASREEAQAAAATANADGFIREFPHGYDTAVGEKGVQLSGGQKQRIAVARALLVDPAVLLLDEATSALDASSEAIVQEALDRLQASRTTLVVAHRLSTIRHSDRICVVADGAIVEQGTHEAMVSSGGAYERLVSRQVG